MREPKIEPIYRYGVLYGVSVTEEMPVAEYVRRYGKSLNARMCDCTGNGICGYCHPQRQMRAEELRSKGNLGR